MQHKCAAAAAVVLAELQTIDKAMVARPDMQNVLLRHRTVIFLKAAAIRAAIEGTILQDGSSSCL